MHTLMHYKSFERLLIARIGPSIARHIALEEVVASGGPTVASQITLVELLLAEANAYTCALGVRSRFELRMQETHLIEASAGKATAQVQDELSVAQVRVSEMLSPACLPYISPVSALYRRCASRRCMTA